MRTSITFKGLADDRVSATVDSGAGPVPVSDTGAQQLADQYMRVENVRGAALRVGQHARILWKSARHVMASSDDSGGMLIQCQVCGAFERVAPFVTVGSFHDRFKPFALHHKACPSSPLREYLW